MKLNVYKNTKKGITAGVVNRVITLILPFFVQTLLIRKLGIQYAGLKGLFLSIFSVLSLTELGVGNAIVYSMYQPIADDDIGSICALLNLYKKLYRIIGLIVLLLGIIIVPFIKYLIKGDYPKDINIYVVYLLFLVNSVMSYWLFAYKKSLLLAYQRVDVISKIGSVISIFMNLIQVITLIFIKSFYIYQVIMIVFTVLNNILISKSVDKKYPGIKCDGKVESSVLNDIKTNVKGIFISQVCGATRNTFDTIFISSFIGLTCAAIYSNYFYVITVLNGFIGIILETLVSGVGNSMLTEGKHTQYKNMMIYNFIYMIIAGWMTICMMCFYQPFMIIWVKEDNTFPINIMILFPIYFYILKMGDIRGVYSDAAGLFWENRYRSIIEAIANVVLNYVLVICFGVIGILMATILSLFFIGFLGSTRVIFKHYFIEGMQQYLKQHVQLLILTFSIGIVAFIVCMLVKNSSFIVGIVFRVIMCFLIVPFIYFVIIRNIPIYKDAKTIVNNIIKS